MARGTAGQTAKARARCGAKKRAGGTCTLAPGWGTPHPGIGKCKLHGGSVPNHVKAAAKEEYRILLGKPIEVNPLDALMMCIKIRAGEVQWLSERMAELDKEAWIEQTLTGKQFHLYARERAAAISDLARYSQMAISLGIAERAVKLAEVYGETIAKLINGILGELKPYMNDEGVAQIPIIVRKHLILLQGGSEADVATEQRAITRKTAAA
jgi:hypothetical protein